MRTSRPPRAPSCARGWKVDYIAIRHGPALRILTPEGYDHPNLLIVLGAAMLGSTRLIDNVDVRTARLMTDRLGFASSSRCCCAACHGAGREPGLPCASIRLVVLFPPGAGTDAVARWWRRSWASRCRRPSWSTTARVPAEPSERPRSRRPSPTDTPCCSSPRRLPPSPRPRAMPVTIRCGSLSRSRRSPSARSCSSSTRVSPPTACRLSSRWRGRSRDSSTTARRAPAA